MRNDPRFRRLRTSRFVLWVLVWCSVAGCSVMTPYEGDFGCPPGYGGICESMDQAHGDSVNGIDPREFDPKWRKARRKWEEKHGDLLEARREARKADNETGGEAPAYRESLFEELRGLIEEPETPVVLPPRIIRVLVLGFADGESYVAPHYVYFMLDEAKWVLKKFPERVIPVRSIPNAKAPEEEASEGEEPESGRAPSAAIEGPHEAP